MTAPIPLPEVGTAGSSTRCCARELAAAVTSSRSKVST